MLLREGVLSFNAFAKSLMNYFYTKNLCPLLGIIFLYNFVTARKSGNIILTYLKPFSSSTHQSIKRRLVTERLTEIYTQMQLHVIGCVELTPRVAN